MTNEGKLSKPAGTKMTNEIEKNPAFEHEVALISEGNAAKYLGLSPRTLGEWRRNKKGPKYIRINSWLIRYKKSDLDDFIETQEMVTDN
jgi:predicted DNA-binding transcriptional regulator AlpA